MRNEPCPSASPRKQFDQFRARQFLVASDLLESRVLFSVVFADDFNRADTDNVDNGWQESSGNVGGNLVLRSGHITSVKVDGEAGIFRPLDTSRPVSLSADLTDMSGFGGVTLRYDHRIAIRSDGGLHDGYRIELQRGDAHFNDSRVSLYDGTTIVGTLASTFQFGPAITLIATFTSDGSVDGHVSDAQHDFPYHFDNRHGITSSGENVTYATSFPDGRSSAFIYPTMDNLVVEDAAVPPAASLADPHPGGLLWDSTINARGYVDVNFQSNSASAIDAVSILDSSPEFTLNGPSTTHVRLNGAPMLVKGTTYRYFFSGKFSAGAVNVTFLAGSFEDNAGQVNPANEQLFTITADPTVEDVPKLDIRSLQKNTDVPYVKDRVHLGADYNSIHDLAGDVGTLVLAPVTGRVIFFRAYGKNPAENYGDLLVAIEVPISGSPSLVREDFGSPAPIASGFVTIFLGHLSQHRFTADGRLDSEAPPIELSAGTSHNQSGTRVTAGAEPIGYIAPEGPHNGGVRPHVHVGILPYSEDGNQNLIGGRSAFPGFWRTNDPSGLAAAQSTLIDPNQPGLWAVLADTALSSPAAHPNEQSISSTVFALVDDYRREHLLRDLIVMSS